MKTVALLFFLVATTAAAFPDERRQTTAQQICLEAAASLPAQPMLDAKCGMYLQQIGNMSFDNLVNACVQDCIGEVCTAYSKSDNQTIVGLCSTQLANLCITALQPAQPVKCAGSAAAVVPALLGMTVLLSALLGL